MPPSTVMAATSMLEPMGKAVGDRRERACPYTAPPTPARKPASTNAWSFTDVARTVKARAADSLSRTARSRLPTPLRHTLFASQIVTTRGMRAKR
jgi:hypothetical protein